MERLRWCGWKPSASNQVRPIRWEPIGAPGQTDRVWRYLSFDPKKESDRMPKDAKKGFRDVTLPDLGRFLRLAKVGRGKSP